MLTCGTCACYVTSGGWGHEACNYSKGIFCIKKRIGNKTVLIHTGGVDAMWKLSKSAIPCSLATRVNGQVNPKLMRSIRVWQWRWLNSKENLLEKTGRTLQKRTAMWEKENRASFQEKIPCKLQDIMKNTLAFPRENSTILVKWISSFALAKTTFFQNAQNAGAVFPPTIPDGMFLFPIYLATFTSRNSRPSVLVVSPSVVVWPGAQLNYKPSSQGKLGLCAVVIHM